MSVKEEVNLLYDRAPIWPGRSVVCDNENEACDISIQEVFGKNRRMSGGSGGKTGLEMLNSRKETI